MSYWQMDDKFLGHHKTVRAIRKGIESLQMWLAIRTYVAVNTTDGEVPDEDIDDLPHAPKNPRRWLAVLVECGKPNSDGTRGPGLVDPIPGGWKLHNYHRHGLSAEEVERRKDAARERKRKWAKNRSGTHPERRSEQVPGTPQERTLECVNDDPPFPSPSPTPGEKIPLPPSSPENRPPPKDPMMATFGNNPPGRRADVARVWEAFKRALGYPRNAKLGGPWDDDPRRIADAIDAYDEATCLAVVEVAPLDGMVNGTTDERNQKHDSVRYVFENQDTFRRLLRAAEAKKRRNSSVDVIARAASAEPDLTGYRDPQEAAR